MQDQLQYENRTFITTTLAAEMTGYSSDYVGQLAREGHFESTKIGRRRFVDRDEFLLYADKNKKGFSIASLPKSQQPESYESGDEKADSGEGVDSASAAAGTTEATEDEGENVTADAVEEPTGVEARTEQEDAALVSADTDEESTVAIADDEVAANRLSSRWRLTRDKLRSDGGGATKQSVSRLPAIAMSLILVTALGIAGLNIFDTNQQPQSVWTATDTEMSEQLAGVAETPRQDTLLETSFKEAANSVKMAAAAAGSVGESVYRPARDLLINTIYTGLSGLLKVGDVFLADSMPDYTTSTTVVTSSDQTATSPEPQAATQVFVSSGSNQQLADNNRMLTMGLTQLTGVVARLAERVENPDTVNSSVRQYVRERIAQLEEVMYKNDEAVLDAASDGGGGGGDGHSAPSSSDLERDDLSDDLLTNLGDVSVSNATSGDIIEFDGSSWVTATSSGNTTYLAGDLLSLSSTTFNVSGTESEFESALFSVFTPNDGALDDDDLSDDTTDALAEGSTNLYFTDQRARDVFSTDATGLTYATSTGTLSLTSGYNIPLTASTTDWQNFFATPSTQITAGTGLSWSANTLNTDDVETMTTSLSVGSIIFSDGSSLTGDSGNFFWDDTNDRLGIGTALPESDLDVRGNLMINPSGLKQGALHLGSVSGYEQGFVITGSDDDNLYSYYNATDEVFQWDTFRASDDRRIPMALQPLGGTVGIGTVNPATTLDVSGTTTAQAFAVGGDTITDFTGSGLSVAANVLSIDDVDTLSTSLTSGSIAFSDGSTLTGNNTSLFWDDVNNWFGVGTSSPQAVLTVAGDIIGNPSGSSTQDFLFGSSQLADTGNADQYNRMFFDTSKGSFRAGRVSGSEWDDGNVGDESVAFGLNTTADGEQSAAFGVGTFAGRRSAAFGWGTTATEMASVAFGRGTEATGYTSAAFGMQTDATGGQSAAFGYYTNADGIVSTAFGDNTTASGYGSTVFGSDIEAAGRYSFAVGLDDNQSGVTVPTSTAAFMGGQVGIGTTTPGSALEVVGDITTSGSLDVNGTATSTLEGGIDVAGSILPRTDNTYTLGTADLQWKDVYVGPGSLYINGQKVLGENLGDITLSADSDQDIQLESAGSGNIVINPLGSGGIQMQGTTTIASGESFVINNDVFTSLTGSGLDITSGELGIIDGPGSGLDADTLDSFESSQFLRSDVSDTFTSGTFTMATGTTLDVNGDADFSGNLTISSNGQLVATADPAGTDVSQGTMYINPTTAGVNNVLLGLAVGGTEKARIDAEGDIQITGLFNSTQTSGTNSLAGSLAVDNDVTLGSSAADTLTLNAQIGSSLLPDTDNTYSLGSPSLRFADIYAATTTIDNLVTGGTASSTFTINQGNTSADNEDATLAFERGSETPNAYLRWNAAAGQFEFNDFPVSFTNSIDVDGTGSSTFAGPVWMTAAPQGTDITDSTLYVNPSSGATDNSLFAVAVSGNERFSIDAEGDVTAQASLGIENALFDITNDTLTIDDALQINGDLIKDSGGSSRLTLGSTNIISGDLQVSGLTGNRLVATDGSNNLVSSISSADLANSVTDETGTGSLVFADSPTFTTQATFFGDTISDFTGTGLSLSSNILQVDQSELDVESFSTSLTPGSIAFSDGSTLTEDNTNFFWDDTNDRLGIGTSTPATALDVEGDITANNYTFPADGGIKRSVGYDSGNDTIMFNTSGGAIAAIDNGDWFFTASDNNGGQVGIGDRFMDAHLEVSANGGTGGNLFLLSSDDNNDGDIFTVTEDGNVGIGTTTPNSLLDVAGTAQLRGSTSTTGLVVDSDGNVGVGESTPDDTLSVNGTASFATPNGSNRFYVIPDSPASYLRSDTGKIFYQDSSGNNSFGLDMTTSPHVFRPSTGSTADADLGNQSQPWNRIYAKNTLLVDVANGSNVASIFRASSSQSTNLTEWQDSSGAALSVVDSNGDIGIGTNSPSAALDIQGSEDIYLGSGSIYASGGGSYDSIRIEPQRSVNNNFIIQNEDVAGDSSRDILTQFYSANGEAVFEGYETQLTFQTRHSSGPSSADPIIFSPGTVEALRLHTDGTATIGTTTMDALTVGSDTISDFTGTGLSLSSNILQVDQSELDVESFSTSLTPGSIAFSDGSTLTEDNTNFFWDDTNDRLGVGTTTPTYALDVDGTFRTTGSAQFDTGAVFDVAGSAGAVHINSGDSSNPALVIDRAGQPESYSFDTNNGRLNLRNESGTHLLQFNDETTALTDVNISHSNNPALTLSRQTDSTTQLWTTQQDGGFVGTLTSDPFTIQASSTDAITVEPSGNVGVGVDNPSSALQVGEITTNAPNNFITVAGYDDFGMRFNGHGGWTDYRIAAPLNGGLHIYNEGSSNTSNRIELGQPEDANAEIEFATENNDFIRVNTNGAYDSGKIGVLNPSDDYAGNIYIDAAHSPGEFSRFTFNGSGVFESQALDVTSTTTDSTIAGNLGIGTASPSAPLHILNSGSSPSPAYGLLVEIDDQGQIATAQRWHINDDLGRNLDLNFFDQPNAWGLDSGSYGFNIEGSFLSINGESEPAGSIEDTLSIMGNAGTAGGEHGSIGIRRSGSAPSGVRLVAIQDGGGDNDDYGLGIFTHEGPTGGSPTEKVRISGNGNVGVGTTTPASTLDVAGTTTAQAFSVGGDTITDFTGDNLSVTNGVLNAATGGSGEDNDGTNLGTGAGWYGGKNGTTLEFKSAVAGSNVSISTTTDEVTISSTQLSEADAESYIFDADNTGTLSSGTLDLSSLSYTGSLGIGNTDLTAGDLLSFSGSTLNAGGTESAFETAFFDVVTPAENNDSADDLSDNTTDDLAEGSTNLYSQWGETGTDIFYTGGNVGIGTNGPSALLEVSGSGSTPRFRVESATSGVYALEVDENDNVTVGTGNDDIYFNTDGGTKVGIGTNSPSSILDVQGTSSTAFSVSNGSGQNLIEADTTNNKFIVRQAGGTAGDQELQISYTSHPNNNVLFDNAGRNGFQFEESGTLIATLNSDDWHPQGGNNTALGQSGNRFSTLFTDNTLDVVLSSDTQAATFQANSTQTSNLTEWQDSAGNVLSAVDASGNVGIGTTSPGSNLHIADTAPELRLQTTGADNYSSIIFDEGGFGNTDGYMTLRYNDGTNAIEIYDPLNDAVRFQVDREQPQVSIGQDSDPDAGLEIIESGFAPLMVSSYSNGDGDLLTFNSSGQLGIGTTTPASALDVAGTTTADAFSVGGDTITDFTGSNLSVTNGVLNASGGSTSPGGSDGQVQFNSSGSFAGSADFFWDSGNSRLGIGTNSPSYALDVQGNINLQSGSTIKWAGANGVVIDDLGGLTSLGVGASTNPGVTAVGDGAGSGNSGQENVFLGYQAGSGSSGSSKLFIENSNDITTPLIYGEFDNDLLGIGTASPVSTLDVAGTTTAQAFSVGGDTISDFTGSNLSVSSGVLNATQASPGGSDGYIQFNSSGSFAGSSSFFWDDANSRLGIGTNSPGEALALGDGTSSGYNLLLSSSGQGNPSQGLIFESINGGSWGGADRTITLRSRSYADSQFVQTNSLDILNDQEEAFVTFEATPGTAGNYEVTIGTSTSQTSLLNVHGNIAASGNLQIGGDTISDFTGSNLSVSGGALNATQASPGGSDGQVQFNSSGSFAGSTDFFWDNANSRLGIGTNGPSALLEVSGSGSTPRFRVESATSGTYALEVDENDEATVGTGNGHIFLDTSGSTNVGIGTSTPSATLTVDGDITGNPAGSSSNDFIFGSDQTGDSGNASQDNRFFYDISKGAFRVGTAEGSQWNSGNIGDQSMGLGFNTTASGLISTAIGYNTTASGIYSTALGGSGTASGDYSLASGYLTTASGTSTSAFGYETTASGNYSTVFGRDIEAAGDYSFAVALNGSQTGVTVPANSAAFMGGNVGFGTTTPGAPIDVAGAIRQSNAVNCELASNTNGDIICSGTSDENLKTDINDLQSTTSLAKINQLQGKTFKYLPEAKLGDRQRIGFIAQDVEKIFPELVGESNGHKFVDYDKLTAVLAEAVQELDGKLATLKSEQEYRASLYGSVDNSATTSESTPTSLAAAIGTWLSDRGVEITDGVARFVEGIFDSVTTSRIVIDNTRDEDDENADMDPAAGSGEIPTDEDEIEIENNQVATSSQVLITFTSEMTESWWVEKKDEAFSLHTENPVAATSSFDYLIIGVEQSEEQKNATSTESDNEDDNTGDMVEIDDGSEEDPGTTTESATGQATDGASSDDTEEETSTSTDEDNDVEASEDEDGTDGSGDDTSTTTDSTSSPQADSGEGSGDTTESSSTSTEEDSSETQNDSESEESSDSTEDDETDDEDAPDSDEGTEDDSDGSTDDSDGSDADGDTSASSTDEE